MKVEGNNKYTVKLVPNFCSREDTIREVVTVLDHLNAITNEIFSSIRNRLADQRSQVNAMKTRVERASQQVAAIKQSQKAIKIVSSAKFPCEKPDDAANSHNSALNTHFPAVICKAVAPIESYAYNVEKREKLRAQQYMNYEPPIKNSEDLIACFNVRETNIGNLNRLDTLYEVGLGKPSEKLTLVDSFFLFNTAENPYQNYRVSEKSPLERGVGSLRMRKLEDARVEASPVPPTEDETKDEVMEADDFYYYPSTVTIPDIDVPDHLPDLPGIADSLDLPPLETMPPLFPFQRPSTLSTSTSMSSNFSSMFTTPTSPPQKSSSALSSIVSNKSEDSPPQIRAEQPIRQPAPKSGVSANTATVSTTKTKSVAAASTPSVEKVVTGPPPPPPPPPPPELSASTEESPGPSKAKSSAAPDVRSNLMAAIREAGGGSKLRSAKDRKYEAKKKKQEQKEKTIAAESEGDADLISDLKNALAMRRKGISGLKDETQRPAGLGDIMQKLASTIPTMEDSTESMPPVEGGSDDDDDDWLED